MIALLLAIQWRIAKPHGLLGGDDDPKRRRFGLHLSLLPIGFAAALLMVFIAPHEAMDTLFITQFAIAVFARRQSRATKANS